MLKRKYSCVVILFLTVFLLSLFTGCTLFNNDKSGVDSQSQKEETTKSEDVMKVKVSSESVEVVFELNDSSASKSFYEQLPLTVSVENYSTNEKIFNLTQKLDVSNVWEGSCPTGSIAYFSPWNNIAMYYGDAPEYKGLYPMGTAVNSAEKIEDLTGSITITAYTE